MTQPLDSAFPPKICELWASLFTDVAWLHQRWIIYRQLFGTNQERIDLLNESADTFAGVLNYLFLCDIQISICKISDPAEQRRKKNLTLRRLQVEIRNIGETVLADSMETQLLAFETSCVKIRNRRNTWGAHSDLQTKLKARAEPHSYGSRNEIEQTLEAMRNVMHCVELKLKGQRTSFDRLMMLDGDGEDLLFALLRGKRYRELVESGVISDTDLCQRFRSWESSGVFE